MSYVYIRSEPGLWTVGHYAPDGEWQPESDHDSPAAAAERTTLLNGGRVEQQSAGETTYVDGSTFAPLSSELLCHIGHPFVVNARGRSETVPGTEQVGVRLDGVQLHCYACDVDLAPLLIGPQFTRASY